MDGRLKEMHLNLTYLLNQWNSIKNLQAHPLIPAECEDMIYISLQNSQNRGKRSLST